MVAWTESLAESLGCSEPALKLLLGQIFGYPVCLLHHFLLKKSPKTIQHAYFVITGVLVALWSIGIDPLIHGTLCILLTYVVVNIFNGSLASTVFLFFAQLGYLVVGYLFVNTDSYDISWTMPHCVMSLRLIGLAMDIFDGQKEPESRSKDQKESALETHPSLLEMFSHCFFIGGYLVGPQFSMRKYQAFIDRNIHEDLPSSVPFGLKRFGIGLCYLIAHVAGTLVVSDTFIESKDFLAMHFSVKKCALFSLWAKVTLAKYIAMWLLAEGIVIISGLAYNGRDANGEILWNGGANVKLRVYEKATRFQHMIDSFNINTNAWVLSYVYKRLRFLNNRLLSQGGALLFLSIWHGFHSGYYVAFFCEFIMINFEKQFFPMLDNSSWLQPLLRKYTFLNYLSTMCGVIYFMFFIPHSFSPFVLLKSRKYLPIMINMKFPIFAFFGTWPLWRPLAEFILKPVKPRQE